LAEISRWSRRWWLGLRGTSASGAQAAIALAPTIDVNDPEQTSRLERIGQPKPVRSLLSPYIVCFRNCLTSCFACAESCSKLRMQILRCRVAQSSASPTTSIALLPYLRAARSGITAMPTPCSTTLHTASKLVIRTRSLRGTPASAARRSRKSWSALPPPKPTNSCSSTSRKATCRFLPSRCPLGVTSTRLSVWNG